MDILIYLIFICFVLSIFDSYLLLKRKKWLNILLALVFLISSIRYILIYLFLSVKKLNSLYYLGKLTILPILLFSIGVYCVYLINRKSKISTPDKILVFILLILESYMIYKLPNNFIKYYGGFRYVCTGDYKNYLLILMAFFSIFFIFIASNYFKNIQSSYMKFINTLYIASYIIFLVQVILIYMGVEIKTLTLIPEAIILLTMFGDIYKN
ncbi:hypothetical protein [Thermobrachium celere]|uniref:Uncharacterized protein n=1 Tax=Thermobrachium celere DSM 8682 TaxID=941824 RepID=R7RN37_9CLOT|nr:hypothetical protein [Thermobrachium celere]GFR35401.1 hypothetical protein TCEA9_12130 [Thermobrachium celere]CDF57577.1 hypothetical protein TCEL_01491 [Thermobrachium celere DSM 8682]